MRPVIRDGDACLVDFPWYDTYGEFKRWANAILIASEPQVFWDGDQGWELDVWQSEDHFFFRRGDLDDRHADPDCFRFSKALMREHVAQVDKDCVTTLKQICQDVELDFLSIENSFKLFDAKVKESRAGRESSEAAAAVRKWWRFWS